VTGDARTGPMDVVCLRHGESENVVAGRCPHAVPFLVSYDGSRWHCPAWPA
jgi:hypothetical protein